MSIFKRINIESIVQQNGKYTLRFEFGRESREFPDLSRADLQALSQSIMIAPMNEDLDLEMLSLLRLEAVKNDNGGVS